MLRKMMLLYVGPIVLLLLVTAVVSIWLLENVLAQISGIHLAVIEGADVSEAAAASDGGEGVVVIQRDPAGTVAAKRIDASGGTVWGPTALAPDGSSAYVTCREPPEIVVLDRLAWGRERE